MPRLDPTLFGNLSISTLEVVSSNVTAPLNAVTVCGNGTVDGETAQDEDAFGAPGLIFRPRKSGSVVGKDGQKYTVGAEALAVRHGDRFTPFAWRDLRINLAMPATKPGTVALVGYGGGHLAIEDTVGDKSLVALRTPCGSGSHALTLDPVGAGTVKLEHSAGIGVTLSATGVQVGGATARSVVTHPELVTWWNALASAVNATAATPLTGSSLGTILNTAAAGLAAATTTVTKCA